MLPFILQHHHYVVGALAYGSEVNRIQTADITAGHIAYCSVKPLLANIVRFVTTQSSLQDPRFCCVLKDLFGSNVKILLYLVIYV